MSSATMDVSIDQLRDLPLEKRLEIIVALWETVENEIGLRRIAEAFADKPDRRFEEHVDDPASSIPWEQVRGEMRMIIARAGERPDAPRLSPAEKAEIDRRLARHHRDPGAAERVAAFLDELDTRNGEVE
ncbi:MAG TPA: addiction module protein [Longimicrobium sp.]|nr:addiction module protein [Longimicrobium sp.]